MRTYYDIWVHETEKRKKLVAILDTFSEVKEYLLCTKTPISTIEICEYMRTMLLHKYTISDFIFDQKNANIGDEL